MADEERSEDLNPRGKDVDEKVRQMMDPAIPDTSDTEKKASKKTTKIKQVNVLEPISDEPPLATAPELDESVALPVKGKKVIVPVHHDVAEDTQENLPPPASEPEEKPTTKIMVESSPDSPEAVAEKLDEAIAGLETNEPEEVLDKPEEAARDATKDDEAEPKKDSEEIEELPDTPEIDAPETDKAVKDIVAKEGDELLEVEDAIKDSEEAGQTDRPKKRLSLKALLLNKVTLKLFIFLLVLGVIAAALYPTSRYAALNLAGVRSSSTVTVFDTSTQQPLKNVAVSLGAISAKTDAQGSAHLEKVRLGKTTLRIERLAFATVQKDVTVGWGSNPLGKISLTPTGAQYTFEVSDMLSGKPIVGVDADSGDAAAHGDDKGKITLTIPKTDKAEITVQITAANYRTENISLGLSTKETTKVKMVPARKHVFISKRSGNYDIYSVYVDGKDEKLVLAGSGNEKEDLTLLPHPDKNLVAYVSTRAGKKNADNFILSDLVILDPTNGHTTPVATSERLQVIGWSNDRLVFVAVTSGVSAADPGRNRLLSYNLNDSKISELAKSNYFNDLLMAQGKIYFAPSSAYAGGTPAQFYTTDSDGSNQKSLLNQEVWNILRTNYDSFDLSVGQQWFEYKLGDASAKKIDTAPATKTSRVYLDSPDAKNSAWVDQRDGKGTLIVYNTASKTDTTLTARAGLGLPLVWLDNQTLVFRVDSKDEIADYAISTQGGEPLKIRDVTKSAGVDNWYYY